MERWQSPQVRTLAWAMSRLPFDRFGLDASDILQDADGHAQHGSAVLTWLERAGEHGKPGEGEPRLGLSARQVPQLSGAHAAVQLLTRQHNDPASDMIGSELPQVGCSLHVGCSLYCALETNPDVPMSK